MRGAFATSLLHGFGSYPFVDGQVPPVRRFSTATAASIQIRDENDLCPIYTRKLVRWNDSVRAKRINVGIGSARGRVVNILRPVNAEC